MHPRHEKQNQKRPDPKINPNKTKPASPASTPKTSPRAQSAEGPEGPSANHLSA
jgi:hypothetical protein